MDTCHFLPSVHSPSMKKFPVFALGNHPLILRHVSGVNHRSGTQWTEANQLSSSPLPWFVCGHVT